MALTNVQVTAATASFFGGVLFAMANTFVILFGPVKRTRETLTKALVEAVFSIVAAGIGGWFVSPALCLHYGIVQIESISFFGLLTGMVFWKMTPIVIWAFTAGAKLWLRMRGVREADQ